MVIVWSTVESVAEQLILTMLKDVVFRSLPAAAQQDLGYGPQAEPANVLSNKIVYVKETPMAQWPEVVVALVILLEIGKVTGIAHVSA